MRALLLKTRFAVLWIAAVWLTPMTWAAPNYHDDLVFVLSSAKKFAYQNKSAEIRVEHLARALMGPLGGAKHEDIPPTALFGALRNQNGWSPAVVGAAARELDGVIAGLPKLDNATEVIPQSAELVAFLERVDAVTQEFGSDKTTPAHLLIALADDAPKSVAEPLKRLRLNRERIAKGAYLVDPDSELEAKKKKKSTAIEKFTRDYAVLARAGKFDPVIGREPQIREMVEILGTRKKKNVLLYGDPGVGKTAVVEALQQEINAGNVPENLTGKVIVELDLAELIAGAKNRGELEDRVKSVLKELKDDPKYILFIDELHAMMEVGKAEGGSNIGDLLKPALARGEIMAIGATTEEEIEVIEKDGAMDRRWQRVEVPEPTREETMEILYNVRPIIQDHHDVRISDDAVEAAYEMTKRYQLDRRQPDAAITALDRGASVLAQDNVTVERALEAAGVERAREAAGNVEQRVEVKPFELDLLDKRIGRYKNEQTRLRTRDVNPVVEHRLGVVDKHLAELTAQRAELKNAWNRAIEIAQTLRAPSAGPEERKNLQKEIEGIQRRHRIAFDAVERFHMATAISRMTKRPIGGMLESDKERLELLEERTLARVRGQDYAVKTVVGAVQTSRGGMGEPGRPPTIILAGKTGGGKTLLAEVLSENLFDSDEAIVRINLGDFAEGHSVSRLTGADPNYVGFGEPAQLTDPVKKRPDAVVLADELDKAAKDGKPNDRLFNTFLAPMDKGRLVDSQGRTINFAGTVIIFTTNIGAELAEIEGLSDAERTALARMMLRQWGLRPEFLGRVDHVIVMNDLDEKVIKQILDLELGKVQTVNLDAIGARMTVDDSAKAKLIELSDVEKMGARGLRPTVGAYIRGTLDELNRKHGEILHDRGEVRITYDAASNQFKGQIPGVPPAGQKTCDQILAEVGRDANKMQEDISPERMEQIFGRRQPTQPAESSPEPLPQRPSIPNGDS